MAFKKRRVWTSQPQEVVDVDHSGLYRGTDFVLLGGHGIVFAPGIPTPTSQADLTAAVCAQGRTLDFQSNTSRINWTTPDNAWLRQQTFTRTLVLDLGSAATDGMIWNCELRCDIGVGTSAAGLSAGHLGVQYYDGTSFRQLSAGAQSGVVQLDFVSNQGVGHYLYVNGELVASDSITANITYANGRDSGLGYRTTATQANASRFGVALAVNQRVALSASEIRERYSRRWEVFAPRSISVPVSAGGGPTPTFIPAWAHRQTRTIGAGVI